MSVVRNLATWLIEARNSARKFLPKETTSYPITKPFCEIEARLGILKQPYGGNQRVTSSGPKPFNGTTVETYHCRQEAAMESGVSRTHFVAWTQGGVVRLRKNGICVFACACAFFVFGLAVVHSFSAVFVCRAKSDLYHTH